MRVVLIGASNNSEKFGNKILKDLVSKGHTVIPINPKEELIEGIKCYADLEQVKEDYEIINFVIRPEITLKVLKKCLSEIIDKQIWCQPGASDDKVKGFLEKNNFKNYITDSCIMISYIT